MGRPKESLPFGEETLLHRIAAVLLEGAEPVVAVRRSARQVLPELPAGVATIADAVPGQGPLGAFATGLRHARTVGGLDERDALFVTGCDSPFLTARTLAWLAGELDENEAVVPTPGGVPQPLCAVYRLSCGPVAEALLARGTAGLRDLAEAVDARRLDEGALRQHDPELRFLRNVNTPEDYRRALADAAY
ncbi:MAG: molybdenum cofactor guanylyltransferase [Planctomycetes bacterium]|nr:molybdenum cofactor guanylyltransferase [Planctomycetota bacterium]